jgi:hypothetical protein
MGNRELTIQRNGQHCAHNIQDEDKKKQKNGTQKTKNMSNTNPVKIPGLIPGLREG